MDYMERLDERYLPPKASFYSILMMKDISDDYYKIRPIICCPLPHSEAILGIRDEVDKDSQGDRVSAEFMAFNTEKTTHQLI